MRDCAAYVRMAPCNELGAFFPLAMLLVIMLAVIFAIFYLLIVIHPRM